MTNLAEYIDKLKPNVILRGPIFPELVQVVMVAPMGEVIKLISKGITTGRLCDPILSPKQLATLEIAPEEEPFDGPSSPGSQLKGNSRMERDEFFDYFRSREKCFAIEIKDVKRFQAPLDPKELMPMVVPPQSFCYMKEHSEVSP